MNETIVRRLASLVAARQNCMADPAKQDWFAQHGERAQALVREFGPSGSGFDSGTQLDLSESTPDRLVFLTSFHHMDEHGSYCGWTEHAVTVRPVLSSPGYRMSIGGRNRNDIKDLIHDVFSDFLETVVDDAGKLPTPPEPVSLSSLRVVVQGGTHVYLPLPANLHRLIEGGCSCVYCAHEHGLRNHRAAWDTLAIPVAGGDTFTVHMPEAHGVKALRRQE